jgi:hypothetical protein
VTVHRYPFRALFGDYARSAAGLAVGLGVLVAVPLTPVIAAIFGGITVLFLVFGLRTLQRHVVRVAMTEDGIAAAGLVTRALRWAALERLTLRYYGTRRQRKDGGSGFMQLSLRGGGVSLRLESSIDGFDEIIRQAARAARNQGLAFDPATAGNLLGLGIDVDSPADG